MKDNSWESQKRKRGGETVRERGNCKGGERRQPHIIEMDAKLRGFVTKDTSERKKQINESLESAREEKKKRVDAAGPR